MELYDLVSRELAHTLTERYSTSFSSASKLYPPHIREHVYNIYGWVRIADEIVDSYRGTDAAKKLDRFSEDTDDAVITGFSTNPIIHAFAMAARQYDIDKSLTGPFITSMRMDLTSHKRPVTQQEFETYIYGSAEVVGLMCLKVFTNGDNQMYEQLRPGAEALGSAFQKVNFLRDFAADINQLGRSYFPNVKGKILTEAEKREIIDDIRHDFTHAIPYIDQLPGDTQDAVLVATRYYHELLKRLETASAREVSHRRVRVPDWRKAQILASVKVRRPLRRKTAR